MQPSLRPHQEQALDCLKDSLRRGNKRAVIDMPTGSGKTILTAAIVRGALAKNKRVAFTVPTLSLIDQTVTSFRENGIALSDIGVVQADHPMRRPHAPVQVCSVQTLGRRAFPQVDIAIIDECHQRFLAVDRLMRENLDVIFVGLTATPWSAGLGDVWEDLVSTTSIRGLQADGYLCRTRVFAPSHPDLEGVRIVAGDYDETQLSKRMRGAKIVGDVASNWCLHGENRQALAFCVDRAHAADLHDAFSGIGVASAYIDGNTDRAERLAIMTRFAAGEIKVICSVSTLTTGIDLPNASCLILARPTKSAILYTQIVGRGLRTAPGKVDCLVLDHSDTTLQLGFVEDIRHETLRTAKGDRARKRRPTPERTPALPRECLACHLLIPPGAIACAECGKPSHRPSNVIVKEGELSEIGAAQAKQARQAIEQREFLAQLKGFAIERNYAEGWAAHKFKAKFGDWPASHLAISTPPTLCGAAVRTWTRGQAIRHSYALRAQKWAPR
jgi:DNA repair protein RadD